MVFRATGHLSGAVIAEKGDDVSRLPGEVLEKLIARGLVLDDGKPGPPMAIAPSRKRGRKA
jgi:hypothetical protein